MATAPFDTLKLAGALEKGGFTTEQARTASASIADALSGADLATKQDLRDVEQRLTIRIGGMLVIAVTALVALMHVFPAR